MYCTVRAQGGPTAASCQHDAPEDTTGTCFGALGVILVFPARFCLLSWNSCDIFPRGFCILSWDNSGDFVQIHQFFIILDKFQKPHLFVHVFSSFLPVASLFHHFLIHPYHPYFPPHLYVFSLLSPSLPWTNGVEPNGREIAPRYMYSWNRTVTKLFHEPSAFAAGHGTKFCNTKNILEKNLGCIAETCETNRAREHNVKSSFQ